MEIRRFSLLSGAGRAEGLVVIVDVFRAGTFASRALGMGARMLVPASSIEDARTIAARHPGWLLAGERGGIRPPGFDLGNSPFRLGSVGIAGRTLIHATSSGSRGVVEAARKASGLIMACFANAGAAARYVLDSGRETVSIVAMGEGGAAPAAEDEEFSAWFVELLRHGGSGVDPAPFFERIIASGAAVRFEESTDPSMPPEDVAECLTPDSTGAVPVLTDGPEGLRALIDAFPSDSPP